MVYFNRFCCCWSARFGSIIIGWINIIFSASTLLAIVIALLEKPFISALLNELLRDLEQRLNDGLITEDTYQKTLFFYDNILKTISYLLIVGLILCVLCIVVNVLLLIGVKRKGSVLLLPWLIYSIFQLGIQFGYMMGFSIFSISAGDTDFGILSLFMSVVITVIVVYFWIIVFSVRKDILNLGRNSF